MTEFKVGDKVRIRSWGKEVVTISCIEGDEAWVEFSDGSHVTTMLVVLEKISDFFEVGKKYARKGWDAIFHCHFVGTLSNGEKYAAGESVTSYFATPWIASIATYSTLMYEEVR